METAEDWLIELLPDDYPHFQILREALLNSFSFHQNSDKRATLENAYHDITALRQTEKHQLGLYLSSLALASANISDQAFYWANINNKLIKALNQIDGRESTIDKLCLRFRLANLNEKHQWLFSDMDACQSLESFKEIYKNLENIERGYRKKGHAYEAGRIAEIRIAYEVAAEHRVKTDRYGRRRIERFFPTTPSQRSSPIQSRDFKPVESPKFRINKEEVHYDIPHASRIYDIKPEAQRSERNSSSEINRHKLKNHIKHIVRRDMELITDPNVLPIKYVSVIYQALYTRVHQGDVVSALLLAALIFGLPLSKEDIKVQEFLQNFKPKKKGYFYKVTLDVSKKDANIPIMDRANLSNSFELNVNPRLISVMVFNKSKVVTYNERFELLKELGNHYNIHTLSQSRLTSAIHTVIRRIIANPHVADLLSGVSTKHAPSIYYTSPALEFLELVYQRTLSKLEGKGRSSERFSFEKANPRSIGSYRTITKDSAKKFMSTLHLNVEQAEDFVSKHNALTTWLWHVLLLQTAARPVNHFPGTFSDIDLQSNWIMISDKERREVASHRIIPLSDFASKCLNRYKLYLNHIKNTRGLFSHNLLVHFQKILTGELPILFYMVGEHFEAVTPNLVELHIPKELPRYPLNWPRHFCRSFLEKKTPDNLIKAIYGHEEFELELLNPMSSLPIVELKKTTECFENIAKKTDLKLPRFVDEDTQL